MQTRREFFRGTTLGAGSLFFAPLLRQLQADDKGNARPTRLVFFVQGNGLYPDQIQPDGIDRPKRPRELEDRPLTGHRFAESVSPLQPFADRVTYLHGLSGRVQMEGHGAGFSTLGCWPANKLAYGETIDAVFSKKFPALFPHVGLGVQNAPAAVIYNLTAWERGKAMPTQTNPVLAHKQLFSVAATGAARQKFNARTNLLDFLADDVKRMQQRLTGREHEKLDRYLEAFESMSHRQSALVKLADQIAAAAPEIDASLGQIEYTKTQPTRIFDRLEAQFDIAAGALAAGLTNVVTISSGVRKGGTGVSCDGSEIGLKAGHVGSHGIGHGGSFIGHSSTDLHVRIRKAHLEKLAKFLTKLASLPEGEGSVLDNTLVIFCSDAADSHHPQAYEWPFILIGDLGGRLRAGNRYLRYPWYGQPGHRTVANFYTTLLHAVGDRRDRFGLPDLAISDLPQNGPLEELLI